MKGMYAYNSYSALRLSPALFCTHMNMCAEKVSNVFQLLKHVCTHYKFVLSLCIVYSL